MPRASEKRMREKAVTLIEGHLSMICMEAGVQGPSVEGLMRVCDDDDKIALRVTRELSLETDDEMVAHLTVDAAEAARKSEQHAAKANKLAVWSVVIAGLAVLLHFVEIPRP